jgi:hypothetical protein
MVTLIGSGGRARRLAGLGSRKRRLGHQQRDAAALTRLGPRAQEGPHRHQAAAARKRQHEVLWHQTQRVDRPREQQVHHGPDR